MFKKGHIVTPEMRAKMSASHKGKPSPLKGIPTGRSWNKGKKIIYSEESRARINQGRIKYLAEHGHPNKGKITPPEVRLKQRMARLGRFGGEKHPNWQGGVAEKHNKERHSDEYKIWRKRVFERDFYTCLICGRVGGELNAHHVKRFNDFPLLRYDVDNGKTLCKRS